MGIDVHGIYGHCPPVRAVRTAGPKRMLSVKAVGVDRCRDVIVWSRIVSWVIGGGNDFHMGYSFANTPVKEQQVTFLCSKRRKGCKLIGLGVGRADKRSGGHSVDIRVGHVVIQVWFAAPRIARLSVNESANERSIVVIPGILI